MRTCNSRNGSALLIVLGMLAFMMISAVGFAIYMRQSRVPSSQFRRTANARLLLKSALANAIARLDGCLNTERRLVEGVYNDVYPGVGPAQDLPIQENGDYWSHRVFMPFGPVDVEDTVSTLTLEALAYLPPALINEVRAFSRMTQTAVWRNLSFDAGRYAFCAVDVSDLFDINKVRADSRRTSLSGTRVSLASLFPDEADKLGPLLAKGDDLEGGFLSLADYNVVAGSGSPFAPFCKYIGTSGAQIYTRYEEEDVACVSNALFITDTWFPPTNTVGNVKRWVYNLESGQNIDQPWADYSYESLQDMLDGTANKNTVGDPLFAALQGVGLACLYDYLDGDSIPLSYCLPCTETAPMICGLGLNKADVKVELVKVQTHSGKSGTVNELTGNYPYELEAVKYALKVSVGEIEVGGLMALPFKRAGDKKETYTLQYGGKAMMKVFFGLDEMKSRLTVTDNTKPLAPETGKKWEDGSVGWRNGVCTLVAESLTGNLSYGNVTKQIEALHEFDAKATGPEADMTMPVFWVVTKYKCDPASGSRGAVESSWYSLDGLKGDSDAFLPRDKEGAILGAWNTKLTAAAETMPQPGADNVWPSEPTKAGDAQSALLDGNTIKIVPHVAVWMRLEDTGEALAVDVVPARPEDDEVYGERTAPQQSFWTAATGDADTLPLLDFRGVDPLVISVDELQKRFPEGGAGALEFGKWSRMYAVDPRYNFAPENWFVLSGGGTLSGAEWLEYIGASKNGAGFMGGDDKRDKDIFMFTSDQEFLQSVGELAFLPRVCEINNGGNGVNNWYSTHIDFHGRDLSDRLVDKPKDVTGKSYSHTDMMWRTYTAVPHVEDGYTDPIYAIRDSGGNVVEIVAGEGDFRVNPYSRDSRILDSVVRGTPFDYYAANVGPNNMYKETTNPKNKNARTIKLAKPSAADKYVFGPKSTTAKMSEKELASISYGLRMGMADAGRGGGSWLSVLNSLEWYEEGAAGDDQMGFLDQNLENPLHGVDRKYLYSYWRECFQNRQQLFLVFIRAEPLTVGGMGVGSLASTQLGARGVALVWRDPEPPALNANQRKARSALTSEIVWNEMFQQVGPNRTRILFYHQFD